MAYSEIHIFRISNLRLFTLMNKHLIGMEAIEFRFEIYK